MSAKRNELQAPAHVRWMIRRDLPTVLNIEKRCFEYPWGENDFIAALRQRTIIGMVAERGDQVLGFMIYELHKFRLHLISMAVDPDYSRQGIGRTMVEKLVSKMSYQGRNRVMLEVRETNLPAQLFFKSLGFRAVGILNQFYDDCDEDAYQMQLRACQIVPSDMECVE
jgi:[ribosomal protein S18]-alanine N-acetyltransferase